MDDDFQNDEWAIWPTYVDFLATFSFILFIFIGSLIVVMYGQLGDQVFKEKTAEYVARLRREGIEIEVDGRKIKFNLTDKVNFEVQKSILLPRSMDYLRKVAVRLQEGVGLGGEQCKLVVSGKADSTKYKNDPFGNWNLSANRALSVLKFLYNCEDCSYDESLRAKLVLLGEGDVAARPGADPNDRRVDLVIDCESEIVQK